MPRRKTSPFNIDHADALIDQFYSSHFHIDYAAMEKHILDFLVEHIMSMSISDGATQLKMQAALPGKIHGLTKDHKPTFKKYIKENAGFLDASRAWFEEFNKVSQMERDYIICGILVKKFNDMVYERLAEAIHMATHSQEGCSSSPSGPNEEQPYAFKEVDDDKAVQ